MAMITLACARIRRSARGNRGAIVTEETAEHATPLTVAGRRRSHLSRQRPRVRRRQDPAAGAGDGRAREDLRRPLIDELFELGVMGIEIPETLRRRPAARFFHSVLAVEELSRVDPSVGVLVDVQNTLVINALLRWGNDDIKRRYLPRLAAGNGRRVRAVGGGLRQRRVRADHARRGRRRRVRARTAASSGSPTPTKRTSSSSLRRSIPTPATAASPRFSSSADSPDSPSARRRTSSASARAARAS